MTVFPDTSFLCSLYRQQIHSPKAIAWMARRTGPITVSGLLLLEFRQSLRLQVRLHAKDRTKSFGRAEAEAMLRDFESDLTSGVLVAVPVDWPDVHRRAEILSERHTESGGHRLVDLLHVATALHLGASEFLSFDANQRKLAEAEGLAIGV
ncbi:MAG TPA: type II toxin-antitoxin system VapC family toxin [Bacteroidia bacterium]|nr:type II toxin-antitoxin system VapC family toxin [Bacteroidia bacterium]